VESHDWFGEEAAAAYDDEVSTSGGDVGAIVDALVDLAGDGPVLEFAIGTGRIALPLAGRGLQVTGIELSPAMVGHLRAKAGGDEASIPVVLGDMARTRAPGAGSFALVYLVFNSLMNLTTQDAQVACFENAARHLRPGGCFVVEISVPGLRRLTPGERFLVFDHTPTHVGIDEYDTPSQRVWSHHISFLGDGRTRRASPPFRYAWPSELDLMARLAGMYRTDRWADWDKSPFTAESDKHVSVWRKPEAETV
jgi:SAM-dependent methyltransferase